jgi:hypothetical protein
MNRRILNIALFLLVASFAAPAALRAYPVPRDSRAPEIQQGNNQAHGRFYDKVQNRWVDWTDNEDRAYRQWFSETRRPYREYLRLEDREQIEYWTWRYNHPDRDDRGDRGRGDDRGRGGPGRYYDNNGRDWHDWNDNEERAYRFFIIDNHQAYIDFDRAEPGLQLQFWVWRHSHPDAVILRSGRYYDADRRDWRDWNDNEDRAYRRFLAENRRDYREFARLNDREQTEYWNWRYSHPDGDDRGRRGPGRYYDNNSRDWHDWNDNEDRAFRFFVFDNHLTYIDFDRADAGLQLRFWVWRHSHPDAVILRSGRYYDSDRREWRDWNDREDRAYREYLAESRRPYREFGRLNDREQMDFWLWRRSHPDRDDRAFKRYFDPGHNDSHVWDDNEERAYREFMRGRNWPYRELSILNPKDQQRYWDWRHKHPDRDRR